jgi:lysozyme family protein
MADKVQEKIINKILDIEGEEYTNDPKDSGGPTKWGITEKTARAYGYTGDMRDLSRELAYEIYVKIYWDSVWGDRLPTSALKEEVVDTSVNCSPKQAVLFLQRSLNAFNQEGKLWDDLIADGVMGNSTLNAVMAYYRQREEVALLRALNSLQGAYYIGLTVSRPKDERFAYGWFMNRVVI